MGTWKLPATEEQVTALERAMAEPLPADGAETVLTGVLGDDNLLDMIAAVRRATPGGDVRALVAMTLDELVNWSDAESYARPARGSAEAISWPEPLRERCRVLIERHRDDPVDGLAFAEGRLRGTDDASHRVASCVPGAPQDAAARAERFEVLPGTGPGSHVVCDRQDGAVYRIEEVYGTVTVAPESMREHVLELAREAPAPGF